MPNATRPALLAITLTLVACGSDRNAHTTSSGGRGAQGDAGAGGTGAGGTGSGGAVGGGGGTSAGAGSSGGAGGSATGGPGGLGGGVGGTTGTGGLAGGGGVGGSGNGAMGGDAAGGAGGTATLPAGEWAAWPMPNPVGTGLPNPAVFVDETDGTARDGVTGLVWQRTTTAGGYDAQEAKRYCQGLGSDWRLPTIIELVSLVDYTRVSPAIDEAFGLKAILTIWSSSPMVGNSSGAWGLYFHEGITVANSDGTAKLPVRCVRAGARSTMPHYEAVTVNATRAVRDNWTGLTWQQPLSSAASPFADAARACQALGEAWRLPSMKELQTLIDRGRANPSIDPTFFANTPGMPFWTSSPMVGSSSIVWSVDFAGGTANTYAVANTHGVRCVR